MVSPLSFDFQIYLMLKHQLCRWYVIGANFKCHLKFVQALFYFRRQNLLRRETVMQTSSAILS